MFQFSYILTLIDYLYIFFVHHKSKETKEEEEKKATAK